MTSLTACFITFSAHTSDTSNIIKESINIIHTYVNNAQSYAQSSEIYNDISAKNAFSYAKDAYRLANKLYTVNPKDDSIVEAYTQAASTLGAFYLDGISVDTNLDKALKYYTKLDFRNNHNVKYMKAIIRTRTSFTHNQRQEILNEFENIKKEAKNADAQAKTQELIDRLQKSMKPIALKLEDNSQSIIELQTMCPINNDDINDLIQNAKNDVVVPLIMRLTIVDQHGNKDFLYAGGKQLFAWLYSRTMDSLLIPEKDNWDEKRKINLDRNNRIEDVDFLTYDLDKQQLTYICNEQTLFRKDFKGYYNRAYLAAQGSENYNVQFAGLSKLIRIHSENSLNQEDAHLAQYYCNKILAKKSKLSPASETNASFFKGINCILADVDFAVAFHYYKAKEYNTSFQLFEKIGLQTHDAYVQSVALSFLSQILFRTIVDTNQCNNLSPDMENRLRRVSFCITMALKNTELPEQGRKDLLREQSSISKLLKKDNSKTIISKEIFRICKEDIMQILTNKIRQQNFDSLLKRFNADLALCTDTKTTCDHLYKAHDALEKAESLKMIDYESLTRINKARRKYNAKRSLLPTKNVTTPSNIWAID